MKRLAFVHGIVLLSELTAAAQGPVNRNLKTVQDAADLVIGVLANEGFHPSLKQPRCDP